MVFKIMRKIKTYLKNLLQNLLMTSNHPLIMTTNLLQPSLSTQNLSKEQHSKCPIHQLLQTLIYNQSSENAIVPKLDVVKIIVNVIVQELVVENIANVQIVRTQEVESRGEGKPKDELRLVFEKLLIIFFPYFELNYPI